MTFELALRAELERDYIQFADRFNDGENKKHLMVRNALLNHRELVNLSENTLKEVIEIKFRLLRDLLDRHPEIKETVSEKLSDEAIFDATERLTFKQLEKE